MIKKNSNRKNKQFLICLYSNTLLVSSRAKGQQILSSSLWIQMEPLIFERTVRPASKGPRNSSSGKLVAGDEHERQGGHPSFAPICQTEETVTSSRVPGQLQNPLLTSQPQRPAAACSPCCLRKEISRRHIIFQASLPQLPKMIRG